jgi:copper chaperone CopZ
MEKLTLFIKDMHCANCAMRIEGIEDELPGIRQISASYRQAAVKVEYDPERISVIEIRAAIEKLGYHIESP